ncbi:hypothetical protein K4F52_007217 [Lecanicillium sp. MT-2017a]|nr:hypothetical protein K4F52_007217 [Lecanicillium sp. MT-2017a]
MATVVVKLGGAAITDKSSPDRFSQQLDNLVDGVATAYQNDFLPNGKRLILIHGAGSFGHPPAKKYSVKSGWQGLTEEGDGGDESSQDRLENERRMVKFGMALTRPRQITSSVNIDI